MLDLWHAKDKIWEIFLVHALKISLGDLNWWSSLYLVADFDLLYCFSQFAPHLLQNPLHQDLNQAIAILGGRNYSGILESHLR